MRATNDWPERVQVARKKCEINSDGPLPNLRREFRELVVPENVPTWRSFKKRADEFQDSWVFRGQAKAAWALETTLDRHTVLSHKSKWSSGFERRAAFHERPLLRDFQRQAHQYLSHLPTDNEIVDWLALMQHYGAPTRLLDWTRSPYVGLYFAVEKEIPGKNSAAVWAIDYEWVLKELAKKFDTHLWMPTRRRECPAIQTAY